MKIETKRVIRLLIVLTLTFTSNLLAQLELSVYTDKSEYQYGEEIKLFCKVTNNADTLFEFFAGTYETCQAKFSFNDFNSWEFTACLPATELLTFPPHSSKIYSWIIEPIKCGLPNNEGTQMIIGKYYFGLTDTLYIEAPQFLGGQVNVGFLKENSDTLQNIKERLNITVVEHSEFENSVSELWQIEGYQIDSLINNLQGDDNLTYIEKAVFVEYDNIIDENPLDFYPLHIGDTWQYFVEHKPADGKYNSRYVTINVKGNETINGKNYFVISNSEKYCLDYYRIDSSNATVWRYEPLSGTECMVDSLTMQPNDSFLNECYGFVWCLNDTTKTIFYESRIVKTFEYILPITCQFVPHKRYDYAAGIGGTTFHTEFPAPDSPYYIIDSTLVYAKINGVEYGNYVREYVNPDVVLYPLHVGDYWIYDVNLSEGNINYYDTTTVTAFDTLDGKIYYIIDGAFNGIKRVRIDSATATVWQNISGDEIVAEILSSGKGDTLLNNGSTFWECTNDTTFVCFEARRNVKSFSNKTMTIISAGRQYKDYSFASGIGLIYYEEAIRDLTDEKLTAWLLLANINGVEYIADPNGVETTERETITFSLEQNYPNPFNPSTTIKYSIPSKDKRETSKTKLAVYDILGKEVAILVNKEQSAGDYEVTFDASGLSSGIYFYQLQYGSFMQSKKMILLK